MHIKSLNKTPLAEIQYAFNKAFENYMIPLNLTLDQFKQKLNADNIDLSLSAGAFQENRLVAFILHGVGIVDGKKTAYNGGTGVLSDLRGSGITIQMYQYIKPLLKKQGFQQSVLEVIDKNEAAIHVYKKLGFQISRKLDCYSGKMKTSGKPEVFIKSIPNPGGRTFPNLWNWQPCWQCSDDSIRRSNGQQTAVVEIANKTIGYITYRPGSGSVSQFAVHPEFRRKGIGTALFEQASRLNDSKCSLLNIQSDDVETSEFLKAIGLDLFITQLEMKLKF